MYLNELRHRKDAALTLRIPMNGKGNLPAVMAVMGQEGTVEGTDYRNVPVLAAMRHVPGTSWFIVAKVDEEEIYAPLRERALTTGAAILAIVLAASLAVGLLWRYRNNRWLESQLAVEREYRLILDSTNQGVLGLDREGRHVFVNPAACRMLGYEPVELIGKPSHAIWHYKRADGRPYPPGECRNSRGIASRDILLLRHGSLLEKGRHEFSQRSTSPLQTWRRSGPSPWSSSSATSPSGNGPRSCKCNTTASSKTSGRPWRNSMKRPNRATRAKSEFLANMSHEIRTPMTAILGFADILAGQLDDPDHLEALNIIRRNGDHLLTVINDILDLSKIEAGKFRVERQACSPAAIAADVVSLMRVRADGKGLGLQLEFAGPVPETVWTDPARLRQILLNLVGNAIKFTETGSVRIVVQLGRRRRIGAETRL